MWPLHLHLLLTPPALTLTTPLPVLAHSRCPGTLGCPALPLVQRQRELEERKRAVVEEAQARAREAQAREHAAKLERLKAEWRDAAVLAKVRACWACSRPALLACF